MHAAGAAVHELAAAAAQGVELCAWLLRRCCVTQVLCHGQIPWFLREDQ